MAEHVRAARDGLPIAAGEMVYDLSAPHRGWMKVGRLNGDRPDERDRIIVKPENGYADLTWPYFVSHTAPDE